MAKFSSDFTNETPGQFAVYGGVQGATSQGALGALGDMATGVGRFISNKIEDDKAAKKAEAELAKNTFVGGFTGDVAGIEFETGDAKAELNRLTEEKMAATSPQVAIDLDMQIRRLQQAQLTGSSPASIKARQQAKLKEALAAHPEYSTEILAAYTKVTGLESFSGEGSGTSGADAIVKAQNDMLATAASGIPVAMQMQLAQEQFKAKALETEVSLATNQGKLAFPLLYNQATQDSRVLGSAVEEQVMAIVKPAMTPDAEGKVQGIDAEAAKLQMSQSIESMVSDRMSLYISEATESRMTLTGDQLNQLEKQVRGNVESAFKPYLEALDQEDYLKRFESIQTSKINIANNITVEQFQKTQPVMHRMQQIYGKESAFKIAEGVSRIQTMLQTEVGTARVQALLENDDGLAFAYQVAQEQGLVQFSEKRLQNPDQVVVNPQLTAMADAGNVEALKDGSLNPAGEVAVLKGVMNGDSLNNVRSLMSDKYYNRLRTDVEAQKALRNFTVNESENVFGPIMGMIEQEGIQISFNPVIPQRQKDGNSYRPAQAFTAKDANGGTRVSPDVQKMVNKLNALYTLHGAFTDEAGLATLGENLSGLVDRTNPKFINRHAQEQINVLNSQKDRLQQKLETSLSRRDQGMGAGSIYDSPEERVANLEASITSSTAEMAGIELQIEAQRMRMAAANGELVLPPGATIDQEATKAAGKTIYRLADGTLVEAE